MQRPANTIRQLKTKTSSCTLHDEEVNRLVHMVVDREPEVKKMAMCRQITALYFGEKASTNAA